MSEGPRGLEGCWWGTGEESSFLLAPSPSGHIGARPVVTLVGAKASGPDHRLELRDP